MSNFPAETIKAEVLQNLNDAIARLDAVSASDAYIMAWDNGLAVIRTESGTVGIVGIERADPTQTSDLVRYPIYNGKKERARPLRLGTLATAEALKLRIILASLASFPVVEA